MLLNLVHYLYLGASLFQIPGLSGSIGCIRPAESVRIGFKNTHGNQEIQADRVRLSNSDKAD